MIKANWKKLLLEKGIKLMKIIGITGGIGSGKSTVTKILSDMDIKIIDADKYPVYYNLFTE